MFRLLSRTSKPNFVVSKTFGATFSVAITKSYNQLWQVIPQRVWLRVGGGSARNFLVSELEASAPYRDCFSVQQPWGQPCQPSTTGTGMLLPSSPDTEQGCTQTPQRSLCHAGKQVLSLANPWRWPQSARGILQSGWCQREMRQQHTGHALPQTYQEPPRSSCHRLGKNSSAEGETLVLQSPKYHFPHFFLTLFPTCCLGRSGRTSAVLTRLDSTTSGMWNTGKTFHLSIWLS